MSRFWKVFAGWFAALLAFFILANLAGIVRPMGHKPYRMTGFPFTIAAWGTDNTRPFDWWEWGNENREPFDRSALAANVAIAVASSGLLAWACAWGRCGCGQTTAGPRA